MSGSSQPLLTASFDENLNIPLAELSNSKDAGGGTGAKFVSFRLIELILDDGPEQGSVRAIEPGSVNNGGAEVSGKYGEGLDIKGVVNERSGLARRRMLKTLAPQILEAPLFFHLDGGGGPGGAAEFEAAVEQVAVGEEYSISVHILQRICVCATVTASKKSDCFVVFLCRRSALI